MLFGKQILTTRKKNKAIWKELKRNEYDKIGNITKTVFHGSSQAEINKIRRCNAKVYCFSSFLASKIEYLFEKINWTNDLFIYFKKRIVNQSEAQNRTHTKRRTTTSPKYWSTTKNVKYTQFSSNVLVLVWSSLKPN